MNRLLKATVAAASVIGVLLVCAALTGYRGRVAHDDRITSQRFDCGEVRAGQTVEHTFTVFNPYDRTIYIGDVKKSCGCLLVRSPPERLEPRGAAQVTIAIDTRGLSGPFLQQAAIVFHDHEPITLTLEGIVLAGYPDYVDFGRVLRGEAAEQNIEVQALGSEALRITDIRFDNRYFVVDLLPSDRNSRNWNLRVQLRPDIPYGHFRGDLEFRKLADPNEQCRIRLAGYVLHPVEAEPERAVFGILGPDDHIQRVVRLFGPYGADIAVKRVEVLDGRGLSFELPELPGPEVELPLTLSGDFEGAVFKAVRVYAEADGTEQTIDIECYALKAGS